MKRIALTGGIGSGKSTVAKLIKLLGYPVYEADLEAKRIMQTEDVKRSIINAFGAGSYTEKGLNSPFLADLVFNDKNALQLLNSIVHPVVYNDFDRWCAQHASLPLVINEAAVIIENGSQSRFDGVILVTSPMALKLKRVGLRDNVEEALIMDRIKNQWTDNEKRKYATWEIVNDETSLLIPQVLDIIKKI